MAAVLELLKKALPGRKDPPTGVVIIKDYWDLWDDALQAVEGLSVDQLERVELREADPEALQAFIERYGTPTEAGQAEGLGPAGTFAGRWWHRLDRAKQWLLGITAVVLPVSFLISPVVFGIILIFGVPAFLYYWGYATDIARVSDRQGLNSRRW